MSQHDQVLDNQTGANFRADLNNVFAALFSNSSGTTEPTTTVAYQFWADTTTGILKIRNAANDAWVTLFSLADGITAAARTVLDDATVGAMVNTLGGATSTGTGGLVRKTGAAINPASTGATTPGTGAFTTLSATKATAGDAATFTNGGATPKALYIYTDASISGIWNGPGGSFESVYFDRTAATVSIGTASVARATFSSTGLAVTGAISATGILSTTDATDATSSTAASLKTAGGIASVKSAWIGANLTVAGTASLTGTVTAYVGSNGLIVDAGAGASKRANMIFKGTTAASTNSWWYVGSNIATTDGSYELYNSTTGATRFAITPAGAVTIPGTLGVTGALTTNGGLQTFGANDSGGAGYRQVLVPNV